MALSCAHRSSLIFGVQSCVQIEGRRRMKAIQVTFDEALLEQLDSLPSVKQRGRSSVLSDAVIDYLRRHERTEIDRSYAKGYGEAGSVGSEFRGWDREGVWPQD